ncbi:hypothetical protein CYMTET_16837, partial [Cymbomonas tetramitiformis]
PTTPADDFFNLPPPPPPPPYPRSNRWNDVVIAFVRYVDGATPTLTNAYDAKGKKALVLDHENPAYDETIALGEALSVSFREYGNFMFEATQGLSDHFGDDEVGPIILQEGPSFAGLKGGMAQSSEGEDEEMDEAASRDVEEAADGSQAPASSN